MSKQATNTVQNGVCGCCGRDYVGSGHDDVKDGPCPAEDCPSHDAAERERVDNVAA